MACDKKDFDATREPLSRVSYPRHIISNTYRSRAGEHTVTTSSIESFLDDLDAHTWSPPSNTPKSLKPKLWFQGKGDNPLEVAVATATQKPKVDDVRRLFQARWNRRPNPVLLVVAYEENNNARAILCGPTGDNPPVKVGVELSQAERLSGAALGEPSPHAAIRLLANVLHEIEAELPGIHNVGMLALHELKDGVPRRDDYKSACKQATDALSLSGRDLIQALGYSIETLSHNSSVLTAAGTDQAVAIFLDEGETFEDPGNRFDGSTPVSHALALADRRRLPWVLLTRGRQIRLYSARPDVGVGRKGRAETYIELNLALLPEDSAGYLSLIFGADALADGGTLDQILESSGRFSADLGQRLRDRVYYDVVPTLATAVGSRMGDARKLTATDLEAAYEQTLIVLFRVLFVAYAEDRDLLPYQTNSLYADHSLKHIAQHLIDRGSDDNATFDERAASLWRDVRALWDAVNGGNDTWDVPAYDGGLFSDDPEVNEFGAAIAGIELSDAELGPALTALMIDVGTDGVRGPVDFRSLSVREFGTIYEGLLESQLSVAPNDLTEDKSGNLVPAKKKQSVSVAEGTLYFHNRSGAWKATGSYFTKPFAVEHLLDNALKPALEDHIARLSKLVDSGEEAAAADAFFDFRCADIAMGSGHFLVAAVDRIEADLSGFLALNPIAQVVTEIEKLRDAAYNALGKLGATYEIERSSLLRRMVARRCIYGVDLNPIAVDLARLAIWIHTFVPGLPLSFLDHNLVCGNSLTGVATLDEALEVLDPERVPGAFSLARQSIEEFLERGADALKRLARTAEATATDVEVAREAHREALERVEPARMLFDLVVANRLGEADVPGLNVRVDEKAIEKSSDLKQAEACSAELNALHFPVAFPEVFLRSNPGFDCIIGNPPWEKVMPKTDTFWALRFPGLKSLSIADMNKQISSLRSQRPDLAAEEETEERAFEQMRWALEAGPYPELGRGHPDLYKAFGWRFWDIARNQGRIGVVLPRSALSAKGSEKWRLKILKDGSFEDVTLLLNNRQWIFEDVHPQYTIGLVSVRKGSDGREVKMRGPYASYAAFLAGKIEQPVGIPVDEFAHWSEGASFPLLPSERSYDVFLKMRSNPSFASAQHPWSARPIQGDFNSTTGKAHMVLRPQSTTGLWPVYSGASFNIWVPDTGRYYAWAKPDVVTKVLYKRRLKQQGDSRSAYRAFDDAWAKDKSTLPCLHPRISYRKITRATDSRTAIPALIPPSVITTTADPFLLLAAGDQVDEAYLLGIMSSISFDWFVRRYVEINLDFHLLESFPVPNPKKESAARRRVVEIAGRLAAQDDRYAEWAAKVGVPVASVADDVEKGDLVAELDAVVCHLYGLDENDVRHIFETFHVGWDYQDRLDAVLKHFKAMA